jgi:dipeptidase D
MNKKIRQLKPERIWSYFEEISRIPRCSGNTERIVDYLLRFARGHGLEERMDSASNLVIVKPPSQRYSRVPVVVLQSHVDMVCEKDSDSSHDFNRDKLKLKIEAGSLSAEKTTLGADNGLGMAVMLSILEDTTIPSGALECLFTVDEEIGLKGAFAMDSSLIRGRLLINLDTEEAGSICIGCAGGRDSHFALPVRRAAAEKGEKRLLMQVRGLRGGHSGAEIHLGRGNAIKLLARLLLQMMKGCSFRIVSITGGDKLNAIPREAEAVLSVRGMDEVQVRKRFQELSSLVKDEYLCIEPDCSFRIEEHSGTEAPFDAGSTQLLLHLLSVIPHGVLGMSHQMEGLVETSSNLASVRTSAESVQLASSHRSSVESALGWVCDMHGAIAGMAGCDIMQTEGYPGWRPDEDSRLLKHAQRAIRKVMGREAKVTAIHAGLECGIIKTKFEGMDAISIGPTITGPHSPQEKVDIRSVEIFWKVLLQILKEICA